MCGICGVLSFNGSFSVEQSVVEQMTELLSHRGPDDGGLWVGGDDRVALGHRRLAIVDLSPQGRQPMTNEDGRLWITFNGEIYNHRELRKGLEDRGHQYRSQTDTETILHLYEEDGAHCVDRMHGMFALAIWDRAERTLFMARDRLGVKPLYFHHSSRGVVFASEVKAILKHPGITAELNEEAFHHYLSFGCAPSPTTLFRGIHKLAPAEWMRVSADGHLTRETYWTPFSVTAQEDVARMEEPEQEARLLELLRDAVGKRMMSDVQFGVFLSGGIDSSTNVALMSERMSDPVRTYSVGFADGRLRSELPDAERVARWFGTDHHSVVLTQQDLLDFMPKLAWYADEPVADWVNLPLYYLAELAREDRTAVVQVGEGADELLHGYGSYMRARRLDERYAGLLATLPDRVRRGIARSAEEAARRVGRGATLSAFVSETARGRLPFWGGHVVFREFQKSRLLANTNGSRADSHDVVKTLWCEAQILHPSVDILQRMTYLELGNRLAELLLMRVDKMTMAASVEARVPFLDHKLVEFAMALPPEMKVRGSDGKHVLRRAVGHLLPPGTSHRPKQGFSAPVSEWFRGPVGEQARAAMATSSLRDAGILNWNEVERLWSAHRARHGDWGVQLWTLYTAAVWYDAWIAGRSPTAATGIAERAA
jgi:asparagine synthase (glutamine-hydrolysing)